MEEYEKLRKHLLDENDFDGIELLTAFLEKLFKARYGFEYSEANVNLYLKAESNTGS